MWAEFTGFDAPTAYTFEELRVNLLDQAEGKRQVLESIQAEIESGDVVDDFIDVGRKPFGCGISLIFEQVSERCLCPLDL